MCTYIDIVRKLIHICMKMKSNLYARTFPSGFIVVFVVGLLLRTSSKKRVHIVERVVKDLQAFYDSKMDLSNVATFHRHYH